jgi:hypothetical protein
MIFQAENADAGDGANEVRKSLPYACFDFA